MKLDYKKQSKNIEDRTDEPKVLPYVDPEAAFNRSKPRRRIK